MAAVLYSGRWYVNRMAQWVQNHMDHLVTPLRADVILVVSRDQLFCGNKSEFHIDARRMFGARLKKAAVVHDEKKFPHEQSPHTNT